MKKLFFGLVIGLLISLSITAFAGLTGPSGGGSVTVPGALCKVDGDTWILCNASDTFGDATNPIGAIDVDNLVVNTLFTLGGTIGTGGIDMNNEVITNIGNAGTDFGTSGELTLAAGLITGSNILSDTAGTDNIGSEAVFWNDLFLKDTIQLEGATDNDYQLTLTLVDPTTPDKTITFPDLTGTVVTTAGAGANVDVGAYDLRAQTVTADGLTSGRVIYAGASGVLSDDVDFTFTGAALTLGSDGTDGQLDLFSEQGGTDYTASLFANAAMTSAASFYLPADEAGAESFLKMGTDGIIDYDTTTYLPLSGGTLTGALNIEHTGGIVLGEDIAGGTPNEAGYIKMFSSGDDAMYNTFTAGDNTANATYTLPVAMPASDKFLQSTSAGVMSWESASSGGLYGMNVEALSSAKTLTADTNKMYQYLDTNGGDRIITLATAGASAGDRFIIRNNGEIADTNHLEVKQSTTSLDKLYTGAIKQFIFDGTNWIGGEIGSGENGHLKRMIAIGVGVVAYNYSTAIGYIAEAYDFGTALGYYAKGHTYGMAIGHGAIGSGHGTALGYQTQTNSKKYSKALGYYSECERTGEFAQNINGDDTDQENNIITQGWEVTTANNTPLEMLAGGQAGERFTIRESSVVGFTMEIVARDNVAGHVALYTVEDGIIKRDASNNTAMAAAATVTTVYEDDAGWAVTVTADDANEALIITVTGDADNSTQWAARMEAVETHF